MISWFYAYVEHIEIKTKTVNIMHFPYLDLSQNVKIRDVPYSLKSPRNSECKLAHIYGMNKGILVFNLKYEHAISFINLDKFIIKCHGQYHRNCS
jgi:hypothetical protein